MRAATARYARGLRALGRQRRRPDLEEGVPRQLFEDGARLPAAGHRRLLRHLRPRRRRLYRLQGAQRRAAPTRRARARRLLRHRQNTAPNSQFLLGGRRSVAVSMASSAPQPPHTQKNGKGGAKSKKPKREKKSKAAFEPTRPLPPWQGTRAAPPGRSPLALAMRTRSNHSRVPAPVAPSRGPVTPGPFCGGGQGS